MDKKENRLFSSDNALEIYGLEKSFGKRKILSGLDFQVKRGERILLGGENGCGKSTLMSIIGRLLKADGGRVIQNIDKSISCRPCKKWFKSCGIVFQNPNYQLFMPTVEEEILFGAEDKAFAFSLARDFELDRFFERHPHSLSEGQKRRLTLCAILAQKPSLLLLDEPTVGQDYHNLVNMMEILNRLHRQTASTLISITHDIRCMSSLCDRKLIISQGKAEENYKG